MKDECLICGAPLKYLENDGQMKCAVCHKNPIEIIQKMMALPFCHMHGPEHHVMVGAAFLTAYKNAGGELDFEKALSEIKEMKFELKKNLLLGSATAATQIEGGDKNNNNNWARFAAEGKVKDGSTPVRADDHYNRFREDIDLMAEMGF
ncbi:MAG: family 1 glycosylhydrolase [Clostridia bacterium]|nr:family 1 glycosylhydrolase [Clostridia bacterium]